MVEHTFLLKGGLFSLAVLYLTTNNLDKLRQELSQKYQNLGDEGDILSQLPVVVDLSKYQHKNAIDFSLLKTILKDLNFKIVGIRNIPKALLDDIIHHEWTIFPDANERTSNKKESAKPSENKIIKDEDAQEKTAKKSPKSLKTVLNQVRSGQQLYQPDGDLIIINAVNTGAEVLASGNIHIYGTLKGRALAGIHGDINARIFCQSLEAELISIAGKYKVIESISSEWKNKPVQIYLKDDELMIEPLNKDF